MLSLLTLALTLARKSLANRRLASALTVLSIALSACLLLGVERIRRGARDGFAGAISQTDLIVGARGGSIPLLLATVFHLGDAQNSLSFATYQQISTRGEVAWTIPLALGDSHRGFRVVGTSGDFYRHFHYHRDRQVQLAAGREPEALFDVALGAAVAAELHYQLGTKLTLSHGVGAVLFQQHADKPFTVCGILAATGTPLDRSLFISLPAEEAIHADWSDGAPPLPGHGTLAEELIKHPPAVDSVTAFLVGVKSRGEVLQLQRELNTGPGEALTAIIPAVTLGELWDLVSYAENGLRLVSAGVVGVGLLGMLVSLYHSLAERRREMAILRAIGAGPGLIALLLMLEAGLLTLAGVVLGLVLTYLLLAAATPYIEAHYGLFMPLEPPSPGEWGYVLVVLAFGLSLGGLPAWRAYRNTLADGLTVRL